MSMARTPTFAVKTLAEFNHSAVVDAEWYRHIGYKDAVELIRNNITKAAESFVGIGYYLRFVKEQGLYKEGGYPNIYEFAAYEFGISQGTTTRYIKMNERFSKNGNSPMLDEKFAEFGKSQLQELLSVKDDESLTEALDNRRITSDMTVAEIRQRIKDSDNKSKTARVEKELKDIPGQMAIEEFPEYLPDKSPNEDLQEQAYETKESIVDGEYREVEEKRNRCDVATTEEPKDKTEKKAPAERVTTNDLPRLRRLLDEKKKELDECIKVDAVNPLPEGYIYERKTIVGALTGMLCDLEDVTEQPEQEAEQPELPPLKNSDQRKEWLAKYKDWGLWYHDENIDVNYYKYDFSDGSRLVVTEYPQRHCYWKKAKEDQHYYHLLERGYKRYGDIVYDKQYLHSTDSETYLVDFLKRLQKGGQEA